MGIFSHAPILDRGVVMKLKCTFELVDMGEEIIAVPVGKNAEKVRGVVKLNKNGAIIFKLLEDDTSEEMIINTIGEKYDNEKKDIAEMVHSVIDILRKEGLIIE